MLGHIILLCTVTNDKIATMSSVRDDEFRPSVIYHFKNKNLSDPSFGDGLECTYKAGFIKCLDDLNMFREEALIASSFKPIEFLPEYTSLNCRFAVYTVGSSSLSSSLPISTDLEQLITLFKYDEMHRWQRVKEVTIFYTYQNDIKIDALAEAPFFQYVFYRTAVALPLPVIVKMNRVETIEELNLIRLHAIRSIRPSETYLHTADVSPPLSASVRFKLLIRGVEIQDTLTFTDLRTFCSTYVNKNKRTDLFDKMYDAPQIHVLPEYPIFHGGGRKISLKNKTRSTSVKRSAPRRARQLSAKRSTHRRAQRQSAKRSSQSRAR